MSHPLRKLHPLAIFLVFLTYSCIFYVILQKSELKYDINEYVQFTFLMDDVGVPANYREMPGFGVHTYTLINREGKVTYVKFHWLPQAGQIFQKPSSIHVDALTASWEVYYFFLALSKQAP